jgi:hypothetical protein
LRKALNENPLVQIALIGGLGLVLAVVLLLRLGGGGGGADTSETAAADVGGGAGSAAIADGAASGAGSSSAAAASTATGTSEASGGATAAGGASTATAASAGAPGFEPGPGLPRAVVNAYRRGDAIVLLVTEREGIEDKPVRKAVEALRSRDGVAVFTTTVRDIADYSRIARGVDLNRAPALVIIRPRKLNSGELPAASISYGYRGPESVSQALRDAFYKGRRLPYHPG